MTTETMTAIRCVVCGSPNFLGPCIHYDNGSATEAAILCAWCSDDVHAALHDEGATSMTDDPSAIPADPDDLIAEQATKAPPPEPVPDAADLPGDVRDGVAGEPDHVSLKEGDVGVLDADGARLLYAAGTPEAEAWAAENSGPHELDSPDADDGSDPHTEGD